MRPPPRSSVEKLTRKLLEAVPLEALADLRAEDPATAIEVHFAPVGLHRLPPEGFVGSNCSVDGYYDAIADPRKPWILYSDDAAPARVRFTLIHELGHHLFASSAAHLLDDLDQISDSAAAAAEFEEVVCHNFAGRVLVPDETLERIIGSGPLSPTHIADLKEATTASWEAVAVAAVNYCRNKTAVVILRQPGVVSFSAASGLLAWRRASTVAPDGPLDRAMRRDSKARPEVYRYGQGYAETMFCDSTRIHDSFAIAVLTPSPSDGHFEILEQPDPAWKDKEEFCQWCGVERHVGWCSRCSSRRCPECDRCGCRSPRENPVCPECFRRNPRQPGAPACVDCEADRGV